MKANKLTAKFIVGLFVAVCMTLSVGISLVPTAKAERAYTDTPCEYQFTPGPLKYLPDGRAYVSLQFGVRGNDNARRTYIEFPRRFFTENGWVVNSAVACNPTLLTGLFWNGQEIDLNNTYYKTAIWPNYTAQDVYFGMPAGGNFSSPAERYDLNPGIGLEDAPYNWRGLLGIEKRFDDAFATVNDGGYAKIGTNNYWCLGFNFIGYGCGVVDAGRVYPDGMPPYFKGGDFAGYLNNSNAAARNSVQGALQSRVTNRQPINDLIGFDPNGNQRFHLEVAGMNTRDGNPTWQALDCLNTFPGTVKPGYGLCLYSPSVSLNQKASIILTVVLRPKYTATATTSCSAVTGTLAVPPGGGTVRTYLQIDGVRQGGDQGTSFNWAIPDKYKDGNDHSVEVFASDAYGAVRVYNTTHRCNPNAVCGSDFSANVNAVFGTPPVASMMVNDTVTLKVSMGNNGESIWKAGYPAGDYSLALTPDADAYWDMSGGDLTSQINPGVSNSFIVTLKLTKPPVDAATPIAFRMNYWKGNFGGECRTALRIQSEYSPWLRVQNGNVGALGSIINQVEKARGTYKAEGGSQNINLHAQYAVAAYAGSSNYFCSANAYNYGHGNTPSCGFGQYAFSLPTELSYLNDIAAPDSFFEKVQTERAASRCDVNPGGSKGERYRDAGVIGALTGDVDFGVLNHTGVSNCPVFAQLNSSVFSSAHIRVKAGRATVIVDGDLLIDHDIITDSNVTTNIRPGGDFDESASNRIPNLGIIVKGTVTITRNVKEVDAQIYAGGGIHTCRSYDQTSVQPTSQNPGVAQFCSNRLSVRGGLFARKGFTFGRNYFDASHVGVPTSSGSFDYVGIGPGQVQGSYYGGPAEDIIGNGISLVLPPPGFADLDALSTSRVKYIDGDYSPVF